MIKHKVLFVVSMVGFFSSFTLANTLAKDSLKIDELFKAALYAPQQADSLTGQALSIVQTNNNDFNLQDTYHYNLSKFLFLTGQLDSAHTIALNGLTAFDQDTLAEKASKFHNIIASIYAYQKDYKTAILNYKKAVEILEYNENDFNAALVKNNIANLFFTLTDFQSAYNYSHEAYVYLKSIDDTTHLPSITAVVAVSSVKLNQIESGQAFATESLKLSERYNNPIGLIVANLSQAELYLIKLNPAEAEQYYLKSLELSNLYQQKHFVMLNKIGLLKTYLDLQNYQKAIDYGTEALNESLELENENTLYAIHKNLGFSYAGIQNYDQAYQNLNKAHDLYITTSSIENKAIINDILIKYDTEKKERELAKQDLKIAQDQIKINKRNSWILTLSILLVLGAIIYLFYTKLQKQKFIQYQKEEEKNRILASIFGEEKERERIANELHDGVASALTGIRMKLEHYNADHQDPDLIKMVDNLTQLHDDTRRISHNLIPVTLNHTNIVTALKNYCRENSSALLNIQFNDYTNNRPIELLPFTLTTLYRTVQELIHNVQKHSQSRICNVQTSINNEHFTISIEDEGIGFSTTETQNSQGLTSISKRISDVGGEFIIESKQGTGTLAIIQLNL